MKAGKRVDYLAKTLMLVVILLTLNYALIKLTEKTSISSIVFVLSLLSSVRLTYAWGHVLMTKNTLTFEEWFACAFFTNYLKKSLSWLRERKKVKEVFQKAKKEYSKLRKKPQKLKDYM